MEILRKLIAMPRYQQALLLSSMVMCGGFGFADVFCSIYFMSRVSARVVSIATLIGTLFMIISSLSMATSFRKVIVKYFIPITFMDTTVFAIVQFLGTDSTFFVSVRFVVLAILNATLLKFSNIAMNDRINQCIRGDILTDFNSFTTFSSACGTLIGAVMAFVLPSTCIVTAIMVCVVCCYVSTILDTVSLVDMNKIISNNALISRNE